MTLSSSPGVTIRPAFPDDAPALARLAALDSQRAPLGPLLLAEIDGEPWAAIALETGRTIADPFRPTAALVDLLRGRAAQLAPNRLEGRRSGSRQSRPQLSAAQEVTARPRQGIVGRRRRAAALDLSR